MIINTIFTNSARRILLAIPMLAGLSQAPAYAWETDFYVTVSNSIKYLPEGSISYGLTDPPLLPGHEDACGVLIEDVGNISWYFYEYNSSPAIDSFYHGGDVKVFLPLAGCGNNDTAKIHINGQQILPPDGAADYILLEDGSSFRSIDKYGDVIPPSGGGHVNGGVATDLLNPTDDKVWKAINPSLFLAKDELLRGDPQARLGALFTDMQAFAKSRQSALPRSRIDNNRSYNLRVASDYLNAFVDNIMRCAKQYYEGNHDKAYVLCDQASQNNDGLVSMRRLLRQ